MKISIITPSYNQGRYIRQNIESVLKQNWPDFEHIVVDGGSNDETVSILKNYPHLLWISEQDDGQADALNKGLYTATGDIIGWINSDDYYEDETFQNVAKCFDDPTVQWVIGDTSLLDETTGKLMARVSPIVTYEALLRNPDIVRQQGVFFRRELLLDVGGWNKAFYMVMDYDLWIRLTRKSTPLMLSKQLAVFRMQKDQKSTHINLLRQSDEISFVLKREGASALTVAMIRVKKRWFWLKGNVKTILVKRGLLNQAYLHRPLRGWRG